jgi:hypothetical protein
MRITLKLKQSSEAHYDTDSCVVQIFKHGSKVSARFFHVGNDDTSPLQTGTFQLSQAEAQQLAAALVAVAGGYIPENKKACFSSNSGHVTDVSVGS